MIECGFILAGSKNLTIALNRQLSIPPGEGGKDGGRRQRFQDVLKKVALAPYYTVNRLARCAANCAYGKRFRCLLGATIVARGHALLDNLNLPVEARRTALDQRYVCSKAHLVHVSPGFKVIQRVENEGKTAEPFDSELRVFDICMVGSDVGVRVKLLRDLLRNLRISGY